VSDDKKVVFRVNTPIAIPVTTVLASSLPPPSLKKEYMTSVWSPRMATTFEIDSTLKLEARYFYMLNGDFEFVKIPPPKKSNILLK
jgi:hypothetical protein